MAASCLVERREGIDGLSSLPAITRRGLVVLPLDVQDDDGIWPVQQIRNDNPDPLATACGGRQHDGELSGQGQKLAVVAAYEDGGCGRSSCQQTSAGHL